MVAIYVPEALEPSIKSGVASLTAKSGDETVSWHLPLLEFRKTLVYAQRVLAAHDAAGEVVPFTPKRTRKSRAKGA